MPLSAVVLHVAGSDFYVLPEHDSEQDARRLADELRVLGERPGGTLRLRPRLAPPQADWVHGTTPDTVSEAPPPGRGDPGASWRDVLGSQVESAEAVELTDPVVLWHWAIEVTAIEVTADDRSVAP